MGKFSITEVIEQAVQTEKLGAHFYTEMARKFKEVQEIKKLFETLAGKELLHEKIFSKLKENVQDEGIEGLEEISQYLRAIVESAFFLGSNKALTTIEDAKTVKDAVNHAINFEKESLLYYLGLRDSIKDKETIDKIINEERSHIVWLRKFKQSIVS
jgi:rubrerythrin